MGPNGSILRVTGKRAHDCLGSLETARVFSAKNRFYRANRDLGRIFKTEFLLSYLSEPRLRARIRRGFSRSSSSMHWRGISITGGEDESTPANCMSR